MTNIVQVGEHCFGCTACEHICPVSCICMVQDTKGFLYPQVDEEQCIDCGLCLQACPYVSDSNLNSDLFPDTIVYAAKHPDDATRMQSASGGAFTAISDYILEHQGVVYGAGYDAGLTACHMRASSTGQRDHLRGSKYVQSNLGDTYKTVEQDLQNSLRVLFTGTPCQVAGLRNYLQKDYENLLLVDLICHGVPSQKVFKDYLSQMEQQEGSAVIDCTFRDKSKGWKNLVMSLDFQSGTKKIEASNSTFYSLFIDGTILRPCCYECKFSNFNRPSDITIGDFWGIEQTFPLFDDEKGISLILVNSRKGETFFQPASELLSCLQSTHTDCLQHSLFAPTSSHANKDAFWKDYKEYGYLFAGEKYGGGR
ncbi:MAG TPA: hypothetical protein DCG32_02410 [Sphaerochaeta sp.]|nr:hypothetical protein [Sphaerochaeta sp.]